MELLLSFISEIDTPDSLHLISLQYIRSSDFLKNLPPSFKKEEFKKAAELGEVSMIDAKHIVSLLDEAKITTRSEYQKQYQKYYAASGKKSEAAKRYYQKHKYEICEKLKNKRKNLNN